VRRRHADETQISTFPFLSVLCAVIGILMLFIIVIISTRAIKAGAAGVSGRESSQPANLRKLGIDDGEHRALNVRIAHLREELAESRARLEHLRVMHVQLVDLIEAKEQGERAPVRRVGTRLRQKDKVYVVPDDDRHVEMDPIRVEVTGDGYTVYPEQDHYPREQLGRPDSKLRQFIRSVDARRHEKYLVFLIRPNGVVAFQEIDDYVFETYRRRIRIGSEPIPLDWQLVEPEEEKPD